MSKKLFTERNVYGWISEDDKKRFEGQVLYSSNVDLTTSSDFYTTTQRPTIEQATTDNIISIFEANWLVIFCDNDSNLYKVWSATPVLTTKRIVGSWVTSEFLYMFDTLEDIHRISLTNLSQADWTTFITTTDTTIPWSSSDPFIISDEDKAYIGIWNNVYFVENDTWVVTAANTFTIDSTVVGLSFLEAKVEIFTESWKYLLWDWVAGWSLSTKNLWIKLGLVRNIGNVNYVLAGWSVYTLNWYSLDLIDSAVYSDILDSNKYRITSINPWALTHMEWIFYLWIQWDWSVETPLAEFSFMDDWILTMWTRKKWLPSAKNLYITQMEVWTYFQSIDYLYAFSQPNKSFGKLLYFGYEDKAWIFWLASVQIGDNTKSMWDNGVVIYNTFDWGLKETQKELYRIRIRADMTDTDDTLYACTVDNDWALQWLNWTKNDSKITKDEISPDGYYYIEADNVQFFNITIAIILQEWVSNKFRRQALRTYSLTYEYDITRQSEWNRQ